MAQDPYGFEGREAEWSAGPASADTASAHWLAGVSVVVWGLAGLAWCLGCSGLFFPTFEQEPGDGPFDLLGVWTILMFPAYLLFGVGIATLTLHGVGRRWWTSVGPNYVLGGCGGLVVWGLVFLGAIIGSVVAKG